MNKKEALTQLEIMATNATGRLGSAKAEERALLYKHIEALNIGIDAIKRTNSLTLIPSGTVEEPKTGEWIPCSERLPEIDNVNEINEFDVLLAVRPKKHPERTPQVYIGKLRPVEGDDGSGNFWGVKTAPCEWTIWGWSYFQEPEVLAWMPLPKPWKGE